MRMIKNVTSVTERTGSKSNASRRTITYFYLFINGVPVVLVTRQKAYSPTPKALRVVKAHAQAHESLGFANLQRKTSFLLPPLALLKYCR